MGSTGTTSKVDLTIKPVRSPLVTVERLQETARLKLPIKRRWFIRPRPDPVKTFELDAIGLAVWDRCDGETTIESIIESVAKRCNCDMGRAEVATLKFLDMLAHRKLIGVSQTS
jgi:hypothetical protein